MAFKEGEHQEKEALLRLQQVNLRKPDINISSCNGSWDDMMETDTSSCSQDSVNENGTGTPPCTTPPQSVCVCGGEPRAPQLRCHLCKDWFHGGCVPFPSLLPPSGTLTNLLCWWDWESCFLCPRCQRSRRPRLETILALLVALQRLPVRLPEGEALQCLTERAINWQGRAKELLECPELQQALQKLQELQETLHSEVPKEEGADRNSEKSAVIVLSDSEGEDGVIDLTDDNSPKKNSKQSNGTQVNTSVFVL